jgi:hypothetical protein
MLHDFEINFDGECKHYDTNQLVADLNAASHTLTSSRNSYLFGGIHLTLTRNNQPYLEHILLCKRVINLPSTTYATIYPQLTPAIQVWSQFIRTLTTQQFQTYSLTLDPNLPPIPPALATLVQEWLECCLLWEASQHIYTSIVRRGSEVLAQIGECTSSHPEWENMWLSLRDVCQKFINESRSDDFQGWRQAYYKTSYILHL